MNSSTDRGFARRLARLRREAAREWRARRTPPRRDTGRPIERGLAWPERLALFTVTALVLGALPFVALVRGSVYLHQARGLPAWLALAAGVLITTGLVTAYAAWLVRRVTGRGRPGAVLRWFGLPLASFYAAYTLIYVSSNNLKRPELRAHYTALHPLLRVGLASLVLADRELLLTDLARRPADYARLGLPRREASLHYRQTDGWVHAVDLRTAGRSGTVNLLVSWYFRGMGFTTLRHVGTADHLHVALPVP